MRYGHDDEFESGMMPFRVWTCTKTRAVDTSLADKFYQQSLESNRLIFCFGHKGLFLKGTTATTPAPLLVNLIASKSGVASVAFLLLQFEETRYYIRSTPW